MYKRSRLSQSAHYEFMFTGLDRHHFSQGFRTIQKLWVQAFSVLSKIAINSELIEGIVEKWNQKNMVFTFGMIAISPRIEEYAG